MYKRDYHPDENIVFDTKNYGFTSPKSTGLEPLSNALVQIDAALKKEETDRIAEDVRINGRVDKEIEDRQKDVSALNNRVDNEIADRKSADNITNKTLNMLNDNAMQNIGAICAIKWSNDEKMSYIPTFRSKNTYYAKLNYTSRGGEELIIYLPKPRSVFLPAITIVNEHSTLSLRNFERKPSLDQNDLTAYSTGVFPTSSYAFSFSFWIQFT